MVLSAARSRAMKPRASTGAPGSGPELPAEDRGGPAAPGEQGHQHRQHAPPKLPRGTPSCPWLEGSHAGIRGSGVMPCPGGGIPRFALAGGGRATLLAGPREAWPGVPQLTGVLRALCRAGFPVRVTPRCPTAGLALRALAPRTLRGVKSPAMPSPSAHTPAGTNNQVPTLLGASRAWHTAALCPWLVRVTPVFTYPRVLCLWPLALRREEGSPAVALQGPRRTPLHPQRGSAGSRAAGRGLTAPQAGN